MKSIDHKFHMGKMIPWREAGAMIRKGRQGGSSELLTPAQQREIDAHFKAELRELGSDFPYDEFCDLAPADTRFAMKRLRVPDPLTLLVACVVIAAGAQLRVAGRRVSTPEGSAHRQERGGGWDLRAVWLRDPVGSLRRHGRHPARDGQCR